MRGIGRSSWARGVVLATLVVGAVAAGCSSQSSSPVGPAPNDEDSPWPRHFPEDDSAAPSPTSRPPTPSSGLLPQFGRTVIQADAPPPLSGGTLLVTEDGVAVAADPDRDQVYVVTLSDRTVKKVFLGKHDEPGRVVVDDAGRAHVVLRRGGAVATIDIATGTLLARRDVCPAPRGIAFDKNRSRLLVACADGQVAALPPAPDGAKVAFTTLERDLRDVVVLGDRIFVSQFRSAKIFELTTEGVLQASIAVVDDPMVEATLAWRMISPSAAAPVDASTGDDTTLPVVLHQLASRAPLSTSPGGYGGNGSPGGGDVDGCQIHKSTTSMLRAASDRTYLLPTNVVLPVDVAKVKAGYAVVAAGNGHTPGLAQVYVIASDRKSIEDGVCNLPIPVEITGQATSVAAYQDSFVVQSREPASLVIPPTNLVIPLDDTSREDTGHAIFHSNSGAGLACASCHGEGGDDGHVWDFDKIGTRRTPSMHGTLAGTAPYHWNGEESDLGRLTDDVMTGRMSGPVLAQDQKNALQSWLFALPAPAKSGILDDLAVARGKSLFQDSNVGCSTCHSGAQFTNSMTVDVGTGGAFQVPPLVGVGARAPFLHDGCATTLRDRFGACGGGDFHGHTSSLTDTQIGDLIAYLESL